MKFNFFRGKEKPTQVKVEKETPTESEFKIGLNKFIKEVGGELTVNGIEVLGERVFAFFVSSDVVSQVENFLAGNGYEGEKNLDDPYNFPEPGKYRKIFFPSRQAVEGDEEKYFFRVAEKR